MNMAEILSLSSGCKFDLIRKARVKDLIETHPQFGKKKSKKRTVIDCLAGDARLAQASESVFP